MRVGGLLLITLVWVLPSCGLETVASLSAPDVSYTDQTLVTSYSLSMVHDQDRYDGTDFQGYEIYYKVYPVSVSGEFAKLIFDRDRLATSPTVSRLTTALGYSRFTVSRFSDGAGLDREPLLALPGDGQTMTLDFRDFLQASGTDLNTQPVLRFGGVFSTKPYLYRAATLTDNTSLFRSLRVATSKSLDMDSWSAAAGNHYEIDVFIVAYGLTPTLEAVYSKPVPWGVIHTIE